MKYLSLLKDSLVQTLDRKSFYVVLVLSALLVLFCASTGFQALEPPEAINYLLENFNRFHPESKPMDTHVYKELKIDARDVVVQNNDYTFILQATPASEFHKEVWKWNSLLKKPAAQKGEEPPDPELEVRFLRTQFRSAMLTRTEIDPMPPAGDRREFRVTIRNPRQVALRGANKLTFAFGALSTLLPASKAEFLAGVEIVVADALGGFFGLLIGIVFTAGFVPGMLQKGTLDLVLAKPVRRPLILLAKYAGGLFYVAIPATVLIGGCWLALSWRSGYFNYGFLVTIGVVVAVYAVLYSFTVLMGVLTRSTIAAILLTIGLWFFSFLLTVVMQLPEQRVNVPGALLTTVERVSVVFPRTTELKEISAYFVLKGNLGPEIEQAMESGVTYGRYPTPKWVPLIVSSLAFIAVMLGLSCWVFSRRDY